MRRPLAMLPLAIVAKSAWSILTGLVPASAALPYIPPQPSARLGDGQARTSSISQPLWNTFAAAPGRLRYGNSHIRREVAAALPSPPMNQQRRILNTHSRVLGQQQRYIGQRGQSPQGDRPRQHA